MKNVIIVHGCPGSEEKAMDLKRRAYDKTWIHWLKKKLEEKDMKTFVPLMPDSWIAVYKDWKREFDKLNVNNDSVLVGHSCGCAFLVRWLGETGKKVKKLVLVAPAGKTESRGWRKERDLYNFDVNEDVKKQVGGVVIFISNDDDWIKDSVKFYAIKLNARVIEMQDKGHFTLSDMGTNEFPELLEEVLK